MGRAEYMKVAASGFGEDDKADLVMLRLMLVTVVASPSIDDTLLSECQVCSARRLLLWWVGFHQRFRRHVSRGRVRCRSTQECTVLPLSNLMPAPGKRRRTV